MPINKNAYIRYQTLDKCFGNYGRKYFFSDLLEEVNKALALIESDGIGRTQLFKDIRFMESEAGFSIPLDRLQEGKKIYYTYLDKKFSIKNSPLNLTEAQHIKSALQVLNRFKGLPQFEWMDELIPLLNDRLGFSNDNKQIIYFDHNEDYTANQHIETIFNAIRNSRVLLIEYKDFRNDKSYLIHLHPYILKQYNNRWFVFGLNDENQIPFWNLALDRIISMDETRLNYQKDEFDWENDYFYDIIGVTRFQNTEIVKVELVFTAELAPYILTKPIHPSQSKPKYSEKGEMTISIKVIPNYELERLILSFGENVTVASPRSLVKRINNRIKSSLENYD